MLESLHRGTVLNKPCRMGQTERGQVQAGAYLARQDLLRSTQAECWSFHGPVWSGVELVGCSPLRLGAWPLPFGVSARTSRRTA